ncbi:TetR family transcriptional regulator [Streptomyces albus subsp. chlorinus]|uniref:TetR/AcrR family transcriptional regulator n=1 Tax=Streptomyces albus TaxID=1888 RepID=UPI00156F50CB|nr:TetR/AcrR family transcriptional regulator [Streptomyces albus]NSC19906.1 TetR family transcriptional regulator [Streptomyces albus subsp. chlorinus]
MANKGDRGGSKTRARIARIATDLFLERGFDDVTIAEIAREAGVSRVTVFSHFDRKEDLLLDRIPSALETLRNALRTRPDELSVTERMLRLAIAMAEERHPLSGLAEGIAPFVRVVRDAPTLIARLREFAYEAEAAIVAELDADPRFTGDAPLTAALIITCYRTVTVATVRQLVATGGTSLDALAARHTAHLEQAFRALQHGIDPPTAHAQGRVTDSGSSG